MIKHTKIYSLEGNERWQVRFQKTINQVSYRFKKYFKDEELAKQFIDEFGPEFLKDPQKFCKENTRFRPSPLIEELNGKLDAIITMLEIIMEKKE